MSFHTGADTGHPNMSCHDADTDEQNVELWTNQPSFCMSIGSRVCGGLYF